ncbi:hypothetical protein RHMOL_Rhmol07G0069000 [Rhododendron molle]|uniref:Uncharacterized protein n=1 Tax=Rhododendron molle TaxID=49168 RepID=A0ACC0MZA2_RHOML|nr:hypothetical protein RHMOL_Rhmol07G0069000 [Rhododendron molle]
MILYSHFVVPVLCILLVSTSAFSFSFTTLLPDQLRRSTTINHGHHAVEPAHETFGLRSFGLSSRLAAGGRSSSSPKTVNVDDFGAKADGTDDSKAFKAAWEEACASTNAVLVVPLNRIYHLKPLTFSGPCSSGFTVQIDGTIKASNKPSDYSADPRHWLQFVNLENFNVRGAGTINGNGKIWWRKSCKINKSLAITFLNCKNLGVSGIRSRNAQQMHITFQKCVNVKAWNLRVIAPGNSPNTDGIHVTGTQNISILSSVIRTGDDCISIVSGSRNVIARDIICGPGHGISIGSLGKGKSEAIVSDVFVNRARLTGTTNGVRIKTWQGGSGYAKNIFFENIVMNNVSNPIIIDQNYCDQKTPCQKQGSAVQVQNVLYRNIQGTSASEKAINLDCSDSLPCKQIVLQSINLASVSAKDKQAASCANIMGLSTFGRVSPHCS